MLKGQSAKRVIAYLCKKRGIDYAIVKSLLQSGKLFQDIYGNCAFCSFDDRGNFVSAELHGTGDTRFKGQTSARQGFGFTMSAGEPKTIGFFESAIDLLSFYQIYNQVISNYTLISMGGLSLPVVHRYVMTYQNAEHFLFVDNDRAGKAFVSQVRCIPARYPSHGKDWNEYLLYLLYKQKGGVSVKCDCFFGIHSGEVSCKNCVYGTYDYDRHCYVCGMSQEGEKTPVLLNYLADILADIEKENE